MTAFILIALGANAASDIQFRKIQYYPSGSYVRTNYQLNREYLTITPSRVTSWKSRGERSEVRSFQLLLAELGQRMQIAAEQSSLVLGGHRIAGGEAVDSVQAGADPHPGVSPRSV